MQLRLVETGIRLNIKDGGKAEVGEEEYENMREVEEQRERERERERETDRQTDRERDRETYRETARQRTRDLGAIGRRSGDAYLSASFIRALSSLSSLLKYEPCHTGGHGKWTIVTHSAFSHNHAGRCQITQKVIEPKHSAG